MDKAIVGKRVKEARKRAGLTQQDLAALLSYTGATIVGWEKGATVPANAIAIIAKATNHPIEFFLLEDTELSTSKIQTMKDLSDIIESRDSKIDELIAENKRLKQKIQYLEAVAVIDEEIERQGSQDESKKEVS